MNDETVLTSINAHGVALVTLNRPEVHNAFDEHLIARLTRELRTLNADPKVRALVLAGSGKSFCAGADLNWMKRMARYSEADNIKDALAFAELMLTLNTLGKPTIARVHGPAFGGGVGLVAACDIAIGTRDAVFSLSEVRLGLIPAVISPYVIAAIGERHARRYFLTAERFDAGAAYRIGLIHEFAEIETLDETIIHFLQQLLAGGPLAIGAAKQMIATVAHSPVDQQLMEKTARGIAAIRASKEGREGVAAFLEKRMPAWVNPLTAKDAKSAKKNKPKQKTK
ncbi:MAG: enoyl-CoA hydratase/isomerase family protein [Burkholderiales bacterium]